MAVVGGKQICLSVFGQQVVCGGGDILYSIVTDNCFQFLFRPARSDRRGWPIGMVEKYEGPFAEALVNPLLFVARIVGSGIDAVEVSDATRFFNPRDEKNAWDAGIGGVKVVVGDGSEVVAGVAGGGD